MAIGTTIDKKERLIRFQQRRSNRIPGGITPEDFLAITKLLTEIREDIDNELKALRQSRGEKYEKDTDEPKELHIRLNESDKPFPLSFFAGWVESDDVRDRRQDWNQGHPGLVRFGDDVYSEIYGEAIRYANHSDPSMWFRWRDWGAGEILEKRSGEKATDPKSGNTFQTCLAIVIDDHAIGTLVVGFRQRPEDHLLKRTQEIIGEWGRNPQSAQRDRLIEFLRRYELGGPRLGDSDWVRLLP